MAIVTRNDYKLVALIAQRAFNSNKEIDVMSCEMDLCAVHENSVKLDFAKLLAADEFNFRHDVYGIINHMNRKTARLENCFLPRCSV